MIYGDDTARVNAGSWKCTRKNEFVKEQWRMSYVLRISIQNPECGGTVNLRHTREGFSEIYIVHCAIKILR